MAIDLKRLAAAAAESALADDGPGPLQQTTPRSRRSGTGGLRSVAAGAVLVGAARLAAKRAGGLSLAGRLPDLSDMSDRLRDRIDDWLEEDRYDDSDRDEDLDDADFEDEGPVDEADLDDEEAEEGDEEDFDDDPDAEADLDDEEEADEGEEEDPEAEAEFDDEDDLDDDDDDDEDEDELDEDARGRNPVARPPKPLNGRRAAA